MTFFAKNTSSPHFGNAGIPSHYRREYYATLCISVNPDEKLERGTGHYFCDIHLTREQVVELIEEAKRFLELNPPN